MRTNTMEQHEQDLRRYESSDTSDLEERSQESARLDWDLTTLDEVQVIIGFDCNFWEMQKIKSAYHHRDANTLGRIAQKYDMHSTDDECMDTTGFKVIESIDFYIDGQKNQYIENEQD